QNACPPRMFARCKVHRKKLPRALSGSLYALSSAFWITVDIETRTPPISSVIVIHLSAPDSAILDDSSATRRLLSKNGRLGSCPQRTPILNGWSATRKLTHYRKFRDGRFPA